MILRTFRNGSALITCMIVIVIVSTMAVGMAAMSGANLQMADNQREANRAFANAESGLEVIRYWVSRVRIPSSTPETEYLSTVIADVQADCWQPTRRASSWSTATDRFRRWWSTP